MRKKLKFHWTAVCAAVCLVLSLAAAYAGWWHDAACYFAAALVWTCNFDFRSRD